ncbi:Chemosensory protein, partial [Operophtera brumata]
LIPEGVQTVCAKCTPKLKKKVAKIIKAIQTQLPEEWQILAKQYNPEGKNKDDIQKFIDENAD